MKKLDDNTRNAIMGLKSCVISPLDYVELLERRLDDAPVSLGEEPLDVIPFQITDADRIYSYRCHILKAYDFAENRRGWTFKGDTFCDNDFLKTASDNDFFEQLDDLLLTHNL